MNSKQISRVATVTKSAEKESASKLAISQTELQQQHNQLDQLLNFKAEYEGRLQALGEQGIQARQLQDYRQFLHKLQEAINTQQQAVEQAQHALTESRDNWQLKAQRNSAMENLVDQNIQRQVEHISKTEQREADERFLMTHST